METLAESSSGIDGSEHPLVLIVDDEQPICSTLSQVLEDESFKTIVASSGEEAIRKVVSDNPDLVFLDIWMPGIDGLKTLEQIKQLAPLTEVVMISGHATIANALEAKDRGAFDFIEKPLDIESIMLAARRALEHRKQQCKEQGESGIRDENSQTSELPLLSHPSAMGSSLAGVNFGQRTLKHSTILYGQGLHSGQKSGLVLEPLPANSGIHFGKIGSSLTVPAALEFVESTFNATTIRRDNLRAATIEHLMAALHSYRISNLLIRCNNEVPIFDGSASQFCDVIEQVGLEEQGGDWHELVVDRELNFNTGKEDSPHQEQISIKPADHFAITYELNYPSPVGEQSYTFTLKDVDSFKTEIAPARTFGFLRDIERLQRAGLAAGGRIDNFILVGEEDILNTELRFPDEFARHKILDVIGDLFLIGRPIRGHVTARMTGHSDNVAILREVATCL